MPISTHVSNSTLTISISGRFDFSAHKEFRESIGLALNNDVKSVNVDMRNTEYLDSSALGMLLMLKDKVGKDKEAISLINAKPGVKTILEIANFGQLFKLS